MEQYDFQVAQSENDEGITLTIRHLELGADLFESVSPDKPLSGQSVFRFLKAIQFPDHPEQSEAVYSEVEAIYRDNQKRAAELNPVIKEIGRLKQQQESVLKQATHFIKNSTNQWPVEARVLLDRVQTLKLEMGKRLQQYQADNPADYEAIARSLYQSLEAMESECLKIMDKTYIEEAIIRSMQVLSDKTEGLASGDKLLKRLTLLEKDDALLRHNTVMAVMEAVSALDKSALKQQFILKLAALPSIDFDKQVQRLCASILDLKQAGLLSDYSADLLINQKFIDKSCQSRITSESYNFFGLASRDEYENKIMWSYYTQSVESKLAAKIDSGESLTELFHFAAKTRKKIARIRGEDYRFGEFRDNKSMDSYSSQGKSVANKDVFPTLVSVIQQQQTIYNDHEKPDMALTLLHEADTTKYFRKFQFRPTLTLGERSIQGPAETVAIYYNDAQCKEMRSVAVIFDETKRASFDEALSALDERFLAKVRKRQFKNDDEFLTALAEFTYTLAKLYPLSRGSGAVTQWLLRGIVLHYTRGLISLKDVRLGDAKEEQRVPYDIYAQMVQDPKQYIQDFKSSLMPYFSVLDKSKDLLKIGGYIEKEGKWVLSEAKGAKIAKNANRYFLKKHEDLAQLASLLNSREPLELNHLKKTVSDLKTDSILYQKNKLSFFDSKIAKQANEVILETEKCLQLKK
ncbi:hypothetical protein DIZ81_06645 [Legionella taurinensis]|uniref:Uncharacterized protein n=2 Tax=Legionella taurinensis TaxID=70611 RepID=A0A3A5L1M4_9GAMM|nr:hypothetical protein DB744_06645 [Legionella taurinensis]PUT41510.1 hypothetical protein DB746_09155 [Legionella taurinensis]PUT44376.1 hypothetical protein DB743_08370 [Legionella taurinensis]PUT48338.1 hypothetical protein DB745_05045 [Legionella taurinensis]RJT44238.1 hypothetical protein D6J04_12855 [Legionella taurinensis]